jgi:hypothetical protein
MDCDARTSNLMFLLSLPLLAAGCPAGDDESTTNNTSVNPTTNNDTGPAETSTGNGSAETSNGSAETSTSNGVDSTTTEGYGYTTGEYSCDMLPPLMGPVSQACTDFTAKDNECYYDGGLTPECLAQNEAFCQYYLESAVMTYGEMCGMAYEELYVCLSMLTCEELEDDTEDCTEESMAIDTACMAM